MESPDEFSKKSKSKHIRCFILEKNNSDHVLQSIHWTLQFIWAQTMINFSTWMDQALVMCVHMRAWVMQLPGCRMWLTVYVYGQSSSIMDRMRRNRTCDLECYWDTWMEKLNGHNHWVIVNERRWNKIIRW